MNYIKYVVILVLLTTIGGLYYLYNEERKEVVQLQKEITKLEIAKQSSENALNYIQNAYEKQVESLQSLQTNARVLEEENKRLRGVLERYRDREEVVKAKPKLIERRANIATANIVQQYRCVSAAESGAEDCN